MENSDNGNLLIPLLKNYPEQSAFLAEVEIAFGVKNLSSLLKMNIDAMILECLEEMFRRRRLERNLLILINELLPILPCELEDLIHDESTSPSKYFCIDECPELLERFATFNVEILLRAIQFYEYAGKPRDDFLNSIFFTMLYYVSNDQLMTIAGKLVLEKESFLARNRGFNDIWLKVIIVVSNRLPEYSRVNVMTWENILETKLLAKESRRAEKFLEKYCLDDIYAVERGRSLERVCEKLKTKDVSMAFEAVMFILNSRLDKHDLIATDLIPSFKDFFDQFLSGDSEDCLKKFLVFLLHFRRESEDDCSCNVSTFQSLVGLLTRIMDRLYEMFSDFKIQTNGSHYCAKRLKEVAFILNILHVLNSSWSQWLDVFDGPSLLESKTFQCQGIIKMYRYKFLQESQVDMCNEMIKICPAIFPQDLRLSIFRGRILKIIDETDVVHLKDCSRENILEGYMRLSKNLTESQFRQEWVVTFENEKGSGSGPEQEMFSILSRAFQRYELGLWFGERTESSYTEDKNLKTPRCYTYSSNGLYPKAAGGLDELYSFGQLMATALLKDYRMDIPLHVEVMKQLMPDRYIRLEKSYFSATKILPEAAGIVKQLLKVKRRKSEIVYNLSLTKSKQEDLIGGLMYEEGFSFEDLCVNFTLPGSAIELKSGGADVMLTPFNMEEYLELLGEAIRNSTAMDAVRSGFNSVLPLGELMLFLPEELQLLICGHEFEQWSVKYLQRCCVFKDGYNSKSMQVGFVLEVLSKFDEPEQRKFLQFIGSTPRLPLGGLEFLRPRLTISRISSEPGEEDLKLPCASTCFNILRVPEYTSLEVTREKLLIAISEGLDSFQFV